jgi:hypothetical protein
MDDGEGTQSLRTIVLEFQLDLLQKSPPRLIAVLTPTAQIQLDCLLIVALIKLFF